MLHWHSVYKVSLISTPVEEITLTLPDDDTSTPPNGKRLSLLSSNMQAEEESMLRAFLSTKLSKTDYLNVESSVLSIEPSYFVQDVPTQIYYKVISDEENQHSIEERNANLFLVCFVAATLSGLELFQNDLDVYCNSLLPYLEKYMESVDISEYLKLLENWHETNICFVERCVKYFSDDLPVIICACFSGDSISFKTDVNETVQKDIRKLEECCNLSHFFMENNQNKLVPSPSSPMQDLVSLNNPTTLIISRNEEKNEYTLSDKSTTTFCVDCVNAMQQLVNPIKMRQLLENYKLKSIQDMNTFKRLLKQAESDYYTLFRAYVFLVTSGNGLVLMHNAKLQNSIDNLPNMKQIMDTLSNFLNRMGGFNKLDTLENKRVLKSKLNFLS